MGGDSLSTGTVLITGATGALGPAVINAFGAAGWSVRTLSRRSPASGTPAASYPHIRAEIDDFSAVRQAVRGADVVVHMAALLHVHDTSRLQQAEFRRVNVEGTATLMTAAREGGVRRVVSLSSIAVYGPATTIVDESTPPRPDTTYARTKLESESRVLETMSVDGVPLGCVLRLAAVYGPSVKGNYERLVHALARRRFIPLGSGSNSRTLVFEHDVANAIVLAASHPEAARAVFNVTDGTVHTVADIISAICDALDRRPPRVAVPRAAVLNTARAIRGAFRLAHSRPPLAVSMVEKYFEDMAVCGNRIRQRLGFEPSWSLVDGWRRTVAEMRQSRRL